MEQDPAEDGRPEDDGPSHADADKNAQSERHVNPENVRNLSAFSALQRYVAGLDLSAARTAQRLFESLLRPLMCRSFVAAQRAVEKNIRSSIDMTAIQAVLDWMRSEVETSSVAAAEENWAEVLAKAIDLPSLEAANDTLLRTIEEVARVNEAQRWFLNAIKLDIDLSALTSAIDHRPESFWDLFGRLDTWIPANLRRCRKLDEVALITLDPGLPLSWIPRTEIVDALVEAADDEEQILTDRFDGVLDDCRSVLADITCEWADQCRSAIEALAAGFDAPAQSHASNIIDSIILRVLGRTGRELAKRKSQHDFAELPLQLVSESLTLRPLYRAFTRWFPDGGDPPPNHFARHATAHAVGHRGLFGKHQALISVMLATSLTRQFWDDPDAPPEDPPIAP